MHLPSPPDGSLFFFLAGGGAVLAWTVGTVFGRHPDGGLLGFSAGMFAVWSAMRKDSQRRDDQHRRRPKDESGDEKESGSDKHREDDDHDR